MTDSNNQETPPEPITNDLYPVIKGGTVIGRKHIVNRINRQDNIAYRTFGDKAVGVVCDGAGSSHFSEVGSYLAAHYLVNNIIYCLQNNMSIPDTLTVEHRAVWDGLQRMIVNEINPEDRNAFIDQTFLHTVVGFIYTPAETYIFLAGDGQFLIDDTAYSFDLSNVQGYLLMGEKQIPYFGVIRVPDGWNRIAVMSDGFETELMPKIWGNVHPRSLQRLMNVFSDAKHFQDDASAVTIEFFNDSGNGAYINDQPLKIATAAQTFDKFFKGASV